MASSNDVRLLVQPDDGVAPVVALIEAARHLILLKMFTFTEPAILSALEAAAARGVKVRVMLNPQRSSGTRANDATLERLRAGGIDCNWTSPLFAVTHEKSMVIDGRVTLVATFNFCEKYFTSTRDYGLVVIDETVAAGVAACFEADARHAAFDPPRDGCLVWSNMSSRTSLCHLIDDAKHSLLIQHPKFADMTVLDRLLAAQHRGVSVRVLCGGKHGISDSDILDTFSSLHMLRRAGAKVHKQHGLRTHAKLVIADHRRALVGSMNIDRSAFDLRRELGMLVDEPAVLDRLLAVFHADWQASQRYDAPDPLLMHAHVEPDHQHDPDYTHE